MPAATAKVRVAVSTKRRRQLDERTTTLDIWEAVVLLAALAILATTTVIITCIALRNTPSQDRARILHAIAELVRQLHP